MDRDLIDDGRGAGDRGCCSSALGEERAVESDYRDCSASQEEQPQAA